MIFAPTLFHSSPSSVPIVDPIFLPSICVHPYTGAKMARLTKDQKAEGTATLMKMSKKQ